ncbi:MFS transporter [Methylophilus luteus]|uniref:MFS transporter n=1 Tax=Methylophilus luteus TaxID=640108 RepID=A0ABW3FA00_9PROT
MHKQQSMWTIVIAAAAILAVTMGIRQSLGLFVSPLNTSTGLGIVTISFAMAIAQFAWGLAQPLFGMLADRAGSFKVIVLGTLLMAAGLAITPFADSEFALVFSLGIMTAMGAGAGSFSILIGAVAARLPAERRSFAAGFINAGGSFGQFIFAPLAQALIHSFNWINALLMLALTSLGSIFLALPLRENKVALTQNVAPAEETLTLRQQVGIAFKDRSYLCLHAGFFTCGFHIAFLVTHLPGEVNVCGLPAVVSATSLAIIGLANVLGSLYAGWLGQHQRMKMILFWMYASRAVAVAVYLAAPKTELTFYIFAAVLGFTWLSTVPPTAGLVGKLFGARYLATLFGFTLLSHQIGGFFGAWLGGLVFYANGDYQWMWLGDIVLATLAALVNLPIREAKPE